MWKYLFLAIRIGHIVLIIWLVCTVKFDNPKVPAQNWNESFLNKLVIVEIVVSAVIGWTGIYTFVKHKTGRDPEWTIRVLTFIHATLVSLFSFFDWLYLNKWDMETIGKLTTRYEEILLCLSLGYFIFDFLWIISYKTEGSTMYFHHVCSIICLTYILFSEESGTEVIVGISGLEITNPCLQARWFLRTHGYQGKMIYTATELLFLFGFLIFRICFGTYLSYILFFHPDTPLVLKAGTLALYIISWVFVFHMISYVNRKYFQPRPMYDAA